MRKPTLSGKVARGLKLITSSGCVIDAVNGTADWKEVTSHGNSLPASARVEASLAVQWIRTMCEWHSHKVKKEGPDKRKKKRGEEDNGDD